MKRFLSALITTLIQLPVILWLFFGISFDKFGYVSFTDLSSFIILACMIYFTFFIAYSVKKVNQHRIFSYFLIPLSFTIMVFFENSWKIQLVLFFISMTFMGYYFRKEKFTVYLKDIKNNKTKKLAKFNTKKEAKVFIKALIEEDLKNLLDDFINEIELRSSYLKNRKTMYQINKKEFNEEKYLSKTILKLIANKQLNIIDGGFKITTNKKVLALLKNIEDCEVVEVYKLRDFIEIEYIKYGKKEYLSLKQSHYMDPQKGVGNYFFIEDKALDKSNSLKEYNEITKSFDERTYLKEPHQVMNDIYKIVKIFYLKKKESYEKEVRIFIIYKNKEEITNSYQIYLKKNKPQIDKYENIFKFDTRVLEDTYRTQFEFSYDEKYFTPKKSYDSFENSLGRLIRKTTGDFETDFPCTTFGKKIRFGFDQKRGISSYNLTTFSKEYQLLDNNQYNHLTKKEKKHLHQFLAIAQLYLNNLFVNQNSDYTLVLNSSEYLEHHTRIKELEKSLERSEYLKESYYTNADQGHLATKFVYVYYDKTDKDKKFFILKKTDSIDTELILKYNENLKEDLKSIIYP